MLVLLLSVSSLSITAQHDGQIYHNSYLCSTWQWLPLEDLQLNFLLTKANQGKPILDSVKSGYLNDWIQTAVINDNNVTQAVLLDNNSKLIGINFDTMFPSNSTDKVTITTSGGEAQFIRQCTNDDDGVTHDNSSHRALKSLPSSHEVTMIVINSLQRQAALLVDQLMNSNESSSVTLKVQLAFVQEEQSNSTSAPSSPKLFSASSSPPVELANSTTSAPSPKPFKNTISTDAPTSAPTPKISEITTTTDAPTSAPTAKISEITTTTDAPMSAPTPKISEITTTTDAPMSAPTPKPFTNTSTSTDPPSGDKETKSGSIATFNGTSSTSPSRIPTLSLKASQKPATKPRSIRKPTNTLNEQNNTHPTKNNSTNHGTTEIRNPSSSPSSIPTIFPTVPKANTIASVRSGNTALTQYNTNAIPFIFIIGLVLAGIFGALSIGFFAWKRSYPKTSPGPNNSPSRFRRISLPMMHKTNRYNNDASKQYHPFSPNFVLPAPHRSAVSPKDNVTNAAKALTPPSDEKKMFSKITIRGQTRDDDEVDLISLHSADVSMSANTNVSSSFYHLDPAWDPNDTANEDEIIEELNKDSFVVALSNGTKNGRMRTALQEGDSSKSLTYSNSSKSLAYSNSSEEVSHQSPLASAKQPKNIGNTLVHKRNEQTKKRNVYEQDDGHVSEDDWEVFRNDKFQSLAAYEMDLMEPTQTDDIVFL